MRSTVVLFVVPPVVVLAMNAWLLTTWDGSAWLGWPFAGALVLGALCLPGYLHAARHYVANEPIRAGRDRRWVAASLAGASLCSIFGSVVGLFLIVPALLSALSLAFCVTLARHAAGRR